MKLKCDPLWSDLTSLLFMPINTKELYPTQSEMDGNVWTIIGS